MTWTEEFDDSVLLMSVVFDLEKLSMWKYLWFLRIWVSLSWLPFDHCCPFFRQVRAVQGVEECRSSGKWNRSDFQFRFIKGVHSLTDISTIYVILPEYHLLDCRRKYSSARRESRWFSSVAILWFPLRMGRRSRRNNKDDPLKFPTNRFR